MDARLRRQVAYTLEAPPALLPLLPHLLADLRALGASPEAVVDLLRPLSLAPEARVLDLGCGKGAVAVALAEALAMRVVGVDAMAAFVEAARAWAEARGVAGRCRFVCADLRDHLHPAVPFDVLVYAALGDVLGPLDATVRALRPAVRPGGYLVIDDAFLVEEGSPPHGYEGYAGRVETQRRLTAAGDEIVREVYLAPAGMQAVNRWNNARIGERAAELTRRYPEQAALIEAYVRRQERESEVLETAVVPALWLLRRG